MAKQLASIHHTNFTALQVIIGLHLFAALFYWLYKRQNLIVPMITGRKRTQAPAIASSRIVLAIVLAAAAAGAITLLVMLAPPPAPMDYY